MRHRPPCNGGSSFALFFSTILFQPIVCTLWLSFGNRDGGRLLWRMVVAVSCAQSTIQCCCGMMRSTCTATRCATAGCMSCAARRQRRRRCCCVPCYRRMGFCCCSSRCFAVTAGGGGGGGLSLRVGFLQRLCVPRRHDFDWTKSNMIKMIKRIIVWLRKRSFLYLPRGFLDKFASLALFSAIFAPLWVLHSQEGAQNLKFTSLYMSTYKSLQKNKELMSTTPATFVLL